MKAKDRIVVTAAVIEHNGHFLITRRQPGVHLEGYWEFPGGKCEPGESEPACLARELAEELGVIVQIGSLVHETLHQYPDREIKLRFYRCRLFGEPSARLGQEIRWCAASELPTLQFPPADEELI